MFKDLQSFFIWSAGSDETLLEQCPESERIKHAGYGALVWIPAIVGFFSMTYAVSTITDSPVCYFLAGLAWSFIVFNIDRFVVSTARKTVVIKEKAEHYDSIEQPKKDTTNTDAFDGRGAANYVYEGDTKSDVRTASFIIRIIFAVFVGVIVAHPVALLTFHKPIEKELNAMHHNEEVRLYAMYKLETDTLEKEKDTKYLSQEKSLQRQIDTQNLVIEAEVTGKSFDGRATTGLRGKGSGYWDKVARLDSLKAQQAPLHQKNLTGIAAIDLDIAARNLKRDSAIRLEYNTNDYLSRTIALSRAAKREPLIGITEYLLILFFVLLDILPVTFKTFTRVGKYDIVLHHERISRNPWAYGDDGIFRHINRGYEETVRAADWERKTTADHKTDLDTLSKVRKEVLEQISDNVAGGKANFEDFENGFSNIFWKKVPGHNTGNGAKQGGHEGSDKKRTILELLALPFIIMLKPLSPVIAHLTTEAMIYLGVGIGGGIFKVFDHPHFTFLHTQFEHLLHFLKNIFN